MFKQWLAKFQKSEALYLILLSWIPVVLFLDGFFLARIELPAHSDCNQPPHGLEIPLNRSNFCWGLKPQYQSVFFVVVDALRWDFVNGGLMSGVTNLVDHFGERALLRRVAADAPTVTMQRLRALTAGSMPTFLEALRNFDSPQIREDNLLAQAKAADWTLAFAGDDTWLGLYPDVWDVAHPFESFNVRDLHTVDRGVMNHIPELLELAATRSHTLAVAHFLGVDHVGHRHGPNHPAMTDKLQELGVVLESLAENLPADSLLVVLGDHGMTSEGNHGGASEDETSTVVLLLDSKKGKSNGWVKGPGSSHIPGLSVPISQTSLLPTVSLLAGLPIPHANLGLALPDALFRVNFWLACGVEDMEALVLDGQANFVQKISDCLHMHASPETIWEGSHAMRANALQVSQYLLDYSELTGLGFDSGLMLESHEHLARLLEQSTAAEPRAAAEQLFHALRFHQGALLLARLAWSQYRVVQMICACGLLAALVLTARWHKVRFSHSPLIAASAFIIALLLGFRWIAALGILLFLHLSHIWIERGRSLAAYRGPLNLSKVHWLAILEVVLLDIPPLLALFSNSYVENERDVAYFFAVTSVLFSLYVRPTWFGFTALILLRVSLALSDGAVPAPFAVLWAVITAGSAVRIRFGNKSFYLWGVCSLCLATSLLAGEGSSWLIDDRIAPWALYVGLILSCLIPQFRWCVPVILLAILLALSGPAHVAALGTHVLVQTLVLEPESLGLLHGRMAFCLARAAFFNTGHASTIGELRVEAAFVGFHEFHFLSSFLLVFLNTFAAYAVSGWLILPCRSTLSSSVSGFRLGFVLVSTERVMAASLAVTALRHHLMLWRVFAPSLVFEVLAVFATGGILLVSTAWVVQGGKSESKELR